MIFYTIIKVTLDQWDTGRVDIKRFIFLSLILTFQKNQGKLHRGEENSPVPLPLGKWQVDPVGIRLDEVVVGIAATVEVCVAGVSRSQRARSNRGQRDCAAAFCY